MTIKPLKRFYHFKKGGHIEWRAGLSYIPLKGEAHNENPCKNKPPTIF
jgi:hypothetical protein